MDMNSIFCIFKTLTYINNRLLEQMNEEILSKLRKIQ